MSLRPTYRGVGPQRKMNPKFFQYDLDIIYTGRRGLDILESEIKQTSASEYDHSTRNEMRDNYQGHILLSQVIRMYTEGRK